MTDDVERIKKKNLLASYYGGSGSGGSGGGGGSDESSTGPPISPQSSRNPLDLNSTFFEPDKYLSMIIKERTLPEIMDLETEVIRETKKLDSEMQTLVSENYTKFISATDTIRKMRSDFKKMEEEMENLVVKMGNINEFNETINANFKDKRQEISKLNGISNLLKKLQFLFDLPSKLNEFVETSDSYSRAVFYYLKARKTLDHYKHMPTFKNIEDDCLTIINKLKKKLYDRIESSSAEDNSSTESVLESINLLHELGEPMGDLCATYIERVEKSLEKDLSVLMLDIEVLTIESKRAVDGDEKLPAAATMDILEFVDHGCNHFLANLSSIIQSYNSLFVNSSYSSINTDDHTNNVDAATEKLNNLVQKYWLKYCDIVKKRFEVEQNLGENTIIVRAVDKFYRRIQSINKQIPNIDLSVEASNIALYAALIRVNFYLQVLKSHFNECLIDLRHNVALMGNNATPAASLTVASSKESNNTKRLQNLHDSTFRSLTEQIKNVLANLQAFIASDVSFSAKVHFNEPFCKDYVRERLLVPYLKYIAHVAKEYADGLHEPTPYPLILLLSRLCLEFESVAIDYLLTLSDEQFFINDKTGLTNKRELLDQFREAAKLLINHYVKVRGQNISQMIRKSVETRDWLNTIEPRNVRAVMKRIVEDLTSIDLQVGELFEAGVRKEKGSDSSRNTLMTRQTMRSTAWSFTPSNPDSKLMNNIQKLFAAKIEIFSQVDFNKISVLTGIVKITLKTLLECVRLKTFSRYGLQQIQVDCHYLQLYLWRFVNDENLIYTLLEEILTSSINRCIEPQLMEPRVVELICENN